MVSHLRLLAPNLKREYIPPHNFRMQKSKKRLNPRWRSQGEKKRGRVEYKLSGEANGIRGALIGEGEEGKCRSREDGLRFRRKFKPNRKQNALPHAMLVLDRVYRCQSG